MKFNGDNKYFRWGLTAFLVLAAAVTFTFILFNYEMLFNVIDNFNKILMPVFAGLIIAYCLTPILDFFEVKVFKKENIKEKKKQNNIRVLSIIITLALFIFLIYGLFALIIPEISDSVNSIIKQYPEYEANVQNWTKEMFDKYPMLNSVFEINFQEFSGSIGGFIADNVLPRLKDGVSILTSGIYTAVRMVINLLIGVILSVYLMYNKEIFLGQSKKVIYAILSRKSANSFINNVRFTNKTFQNFLIGKLIDSLIIGLICFICMSIINLPYAVLVSLIIGVTNIIPLFGPFIGAIPASILIFMVDPKQCIYFIILIICLQQFDGNILGPKILGSSTGLSGFWVVVAITIFGSLLGVVGMLIGVPTFAVLYAAFKSFVNRKLTEKELETETVKYQDVNYIDDDLSYIQIAKNDVTSLSSKDRHNKPSNHKILSKKNKDNESNK